MSKLNTILLAAAAFQLAVLLIITLTADDGPEATAPQALVSLSAGDVAAVVIENPDAGGPLRLEKHEDGWVVASADDFPARDTLIADDAEDEADRNGLLDKLARIEVERAVVRQKENHAVLKVAEEDYERRLTLEGEGGDVLGRLYLSRAPSGRTTYVRREGEDEVWETDGITVWNVSADASSWVTATIIEESEDEVVKLVAKAGDTGTEYVFERRKVKREEDGESAEKTGGEADTEGKEGEEDEEAAKAEADEEEDETPAEPETEWWQVAPEEKRAEKTALAEILRKCCRMSLTEIVGKSRPEDAGYEEANVFTIELEDGTKKTLTVAAETDDGDVHVKVSDNDYYVLVSSWGVKGLREFEPANLVEQEEEQEEEKEEEEEEEDEDH